MPTIFTHPAVPLAIFRAFPSEAITPGVVITGVVCSSLPDIDVLGFGFGIRYGDLLGHRGLTHSIAFSLFVAGAAAFLLTRQRPQAFRTVFVFLFLATVSHGLLDAMTNGGLGIAFLSPFTNHRYFFPWRPIEVSPIGIRVFDSRMIEVVASELRWVWMPACALFLIATTAGRMRVIRAGDGGL